MNKPPDYSLPPQTNYQTSLAMAREELAKMDFAAQCAKAGFERIEEGARVRFLEREYLLRRADLELAPADGGPEPELWEKIVILHYLIAADGRPDRGELITYKQVPDGAPYYDVFQRRTTGILLSVFGGRFEVLEQAAAKLGAAPASGHGDRAFKVRALPQVEYIFVLYEADEEFDADIRVLFDASLVSRLPAEDVTVLCQMVCLKMVRLQ
jgi:hypothetical protein